MWPILVSEFVLSRVQISSSYFVWSLRWGPLPHFPITQAEFGGTCTEEEENTSIKLDSNLNELLMVKRLWLFLKQCKATKQNPFVKHFHLSL